MSAATNPTEHKAKKRHLCSWCAESIEIGERYKRYRYFDGGEAGTIKMHPECFEAMLVEADGGWLEWIPGEFDRPERVVA